MTGVAGAVLKGAVWGGIAGAILLASAAVVLEARAPETVVASPAAVDDEAPGLAPDQGALPQTAAVRPETEPAQPAPAAELQPLPEAPVALGVRSVPVAVIAAPRAPSAAAHARRSPGPPALSAAATATALPGLPSPPADAQTIRLRLPMADRAAAVAVVVWPPTSQVPGWTVTAAADRSGAPHLTEAAAEPVALIADRADVAGFLTALEAGPAVLAYDRFSGLREVTSARLRPWPPAPGGTAGWPWWPRPSLRCWTGWRTGSPPPRTSWPQAPAGPKARRPSGCRR